MWKMSIQLNCPNGHPVRVNDGLAGEIGLCPLCRASFRVPVPAQPVEHPNPSGEFADQAPSPHWVAEETTSSPPNLPYPLKKKTRQCVRCGHIASQSFAVCPRCGTPLSTYRHLKVQREGDVVVVRFAERQLRDELLIGEIAEELCSVAGRLQQQHLVLDFSGVVGVSSAMLGKLVMLQAKMKKQKGDLRLCKVGPEVRDVLATSKLDHVLDVEA